MGSSDVPPSVPPRFVFFAWQYRRCARFFAPARTERGARGPWALTGRPTGTTPETVGPPRFLTNPRVPATLLRPGETSAPSRYGASVLPARPHTAQALALSCLSGLDHAAVSLLVYASQPRSPSDHATLGSGWWLAFPGQGSKPCRVRNEISLFRLVPPRPGLAWRKCCRIVRRYVRTRRRRACPRAC